MVVVDRDQSLWCARDKTYWNEFQAAEEVKTSAVFWRITAVNENIEPLSGNI